MNDETEPAAGAADVTRESEKFRSGEEHPEASAKTIRPGRAGGHRSKKKVRSQARSRVPSAEPGTLCLSVESEPRTIDEPRKKIPRERQRLVPKVQRYRRPLVVSGILRLPAEIPPWELELVEGALSHLADTINEQADPAPREDDHATS